MKKTKWIIALIAALTAGFAEVEAKEKEASSVPVQAEGKEAPPAVVQVEDEEMVLDKEWFDEVWSQIDGVVEQEELHLQETVTVSGVRGAEAEDLLMDKLYYKGGPNILLADDESRTDEN